MMVSVVMNGGPNVRFLVPIAQTGCDWVHGSVVEFRHRRQRGRVGEMVEEWRQGQSGRGVALAGAGSLYAQPARSLSQRMIV